MTPVDLLVAGASAVLGLGIGVSMGLMLRRPVADTRAASDQVDRIDAALEVFEEALILVDHQGASLIGGAGALEICVRALGCPNDDAGSVVQHVAGLDTSYARRLEALTERGEPCAFVVGGAVSVVGRSCGEWAWLRLAPTEQSLPVSGADLLPALLDSQDDPVWIADGDGAPLWVNRAWLKAVSAESLDDARTRGIVFDSGVSGLARAAARAGEKRTSMRWIAETGARRALSLTATPLRDGSVALWARDVTDLENAREAARLEADAGVQVLNHIADATAVFDADRRLVFHNPAFTNLWDLEPAWLAERPSHGELLDRLRQRRSLPETVDYARFKAEELARHQQVEPYSETVWRLPSERTLRVVRLTRPGGGLMLVHSDITPELRLKAQFNHLIQVQRATLDKLSDAVAVFGADGRLRLHNEAFETFWAIPPGQLQRTPDFEGVVELCVPRLHDLQFWRDLKARITDPDPRARAPAQLEIVTAERRVVAFQSRPLPDGATLIGFSDITDTRRLEEALRDREAALAETERLKRAFVGSVSYELRTPLTTIIGYAELLERSVRSGGDPERGYVAAVRAAASHLARSINDVLETAEIDAGEAVLEIGDVNLAVLLRRSVERAAPEAAAAGVALTVAEESDSGLISGDAVRLAQVIDHLIDNALRHTPAGGAIVLTAVRAPGEVCLSVSDNGRGFPFDVQAHIFDRFSSQNRGGPGLGLALVRSLVELHGGWVALESEPGLGATFTCHLPEAAQPPEARPLLI